MSRILIAESDQQLRVGMRHILETKGYDVEEAGDGYEALARLERSQLALVVLDLYLPKVNGLEVVIHLQVHSPSLKILAICGNHIEGFDTCQSAMALGAHEALAKPFSAEEFLQRVDILLPHP
jgi:CheY-like chemotaxis protein